MSISSEVSLMKKIFAVLVIGLITSVFLFGTLVFGDDPVAYTLTYHENGGSSVTDANPVDTEYQIASSIVISNHPISPSDQLIFEFGDINNDGFTDIVFASLNNQFVGWLENDTLGSFSEHLIASTLISLSVLRIEDIDGDSDLDIIIAFDSQKLAYYLNNGVGSFSPQTLISNNGDIDSVDDFECGDIDNNGLVDIIVASKGSNAFVLFYQTSSLAFSSGVDVYNINSPQNVIIADIDNDSDLDILYSTTITAQIGWLDNDGTGTSFSNHIISSPLEVPAYLIYEDNDNDGDSDIISVSTGLTAKMTTYTNEGELVFTEAQIDVSGLSNQPAFYDVDENGYIDLIEGTSSSIKTSYRLSDEIVLSKETPVGNIGNLSFYDVDDDGVTELITTDITTMTFEIYEIVSIGEVIYTPPITEKLDYDFLGWFTNEALTEAVVYPFYISTDTDLYASWAPHTYSIIYHLDGGTNPQNPSTYDINDVPIYLADPIKTGYTFDGWYDNTSLSGNSMSEISSGELVLQDYELYAKWTISSYTIFFEDSAGQVISSIDKAYLEDCADVEYPSDPILEGYTFINWSQLIPGNMPAEDIHITALYSVNQYTISFDENGGSEIEDITSDYSTVVLPPDHPIKTGYDFSGWYIDSSLETLYTFSNMPSTNLTLYALYTLHQYSIDYDLGGGINHPDNETYFTISNEVPLFAPTRLGYTFNGFYLSADFSGLKVSNSSAFPIEDTIVYASWIINQYTVTFYDKFDGIIHQETFDFNQSTQSLSTVTAPVLEGYTFSGFDTALPSTMPAHDLEFKPIYVANEYLITFNTLGGNEITSLTYDYGSSLSSLPSPIYNGYRFLGWYTDELLTSELTLTEMPNYSLTLYASWQVLSYVLSVSVSGIVIDTDIEYGVTLPPLSDPEKPFYTFVGWFYLDEMITLSTFTMPDHDILITAVFEDVTPPMVQGVQEGDFFNFGDVVIIDFNEGSATLNDKPYYNNSEITESGEYTLQVIDIEGNETIIHFTIGGESLFSWVHVALVITMTSVISIAMIFRKSFFKIFLKR